MMLRLKGSGQAVQLAQQVRLSSTVVKSYGVGHVDMSPATDVVILSPMKGPYGDILQGMVPADVKQVHGLLFQGGHELKAIDVSAS